MAPNPAAFWQLLREGRHAIAEVPPHRWESISASVRARDSARWGGFLDEAVTIDPQQLLVLELVWEALEDVGIVAAVLADSPMAVFVGALRDGYASLLLEHGDGAITQHTNTGVHRGMIANRVSYVLGLRGPIVVVDTAQSSLLVAVHLAGESVRIGESTLAIAVGVSLNILVRGGGQCGAIRRAVARRTLLHVRRQSERVRAG